MQRTDEWHRQRRGKLTASVMGQALGLTPWGSPKVLAKGLSTDCAAPEKYTNAAMQWGTVMEPNGLLEYAVATGSQVEPTGFWQHAHVDWIGGSPDGLIGTDGMVEIKCPFTRRVYPELPPYYYLQVNALLEITGRQWCDLCVWTPSDLKIWRIVRRDDHWQFLLSYYTNFWAAVCAKAEPPNPGKQLLPLVREMMQAACTLQPLTSARMIDSSLALIALNNLAKGAPMAEGDPFAVEGCSGGDQACDGDAHGDGLGAHLAGNDLGKDEGHADTCGSDAAIAHV
jgi:putative phage-type endonuclease